MLDVYGDGTITLCRDGRLLVRVWFDGKPRVRYVPARFVKAYPKEARQRAEEIRRQLAAQRDDAWHVEVPTLADFLRSWLPTLSVRPTTRRRYDLSVGRIIAALGARKLDRLRARDVQRAIDSGLLDWHDHAVLRAALNDAMGPRFGYLERNPALGIEVRKSDFEGNPLTLDEVRRVLAAAEGDPLEALWWLAIDTGFRQAELLGLARDDVEGETVTLTAQLQRIAGEWVRVPTKRPRQLATVTLMPQTAEKVAAHKLRTAAERQPDWPYFGLLFLSPRGNPLGQSEVLRAWKRLCRRAGVEERRFHDIRGTAATILKELGVPEDIRMARLGHSTTATHRHYAASRTGVDRAAADALARALG